MQKSFLISFLEMKTGNELKPFFQNFEVKIETCGENIRQRMEHNFDFY